MNKISKILIPFNFKESALNALNYAVSFSKKAQETHIQLLYIMLGDESMSESEIESKFSETLEKLNYQSARPTITFQIKKGAINAQILDAREEFQADLIVMGTKGSKEDAEVENTNTSSFINSAKCPVIVVPMTFKDFKLDHITLAIDKSEIAKPNLLKVLLVIARRFDAKIHVLTVYDENDKDYLKEQDNESILDYYFERYYDTSSATRSSKIADSIIEYDKKRSIDMLAIIPRNQAIGEQPSEGKLTQYLTKHSDIPILIID